MKIAAFQGRCHDGDVEANIAKAIETLHHAVEDSRPSRAPARSR